MKSTIVKHWNSILKAFPLEFQDVYFEEGYLKLYEDDDNEAVCYLYKQDNKILLFPFLRRKFIFNNKIYYDFETVYGYGGPISNFSTDETFIKKALKAFYNYCASNNYIAGFVRFHPLLKNYIGFESIGTVLYDRNTIAMDLSLSESDIWMKEINRKNRSTIKKGVHYGLSFIEDNEFNYIETFMDIYYKTMSKLDAESFYYFRPDYFYNFKNSVKDSFLGLVKFENKIIAGAIFFYSNNYGHYHLSGSYKDYLYTNPNNFMLYEASKVMKSIGVKKFHLGGGSTADEDNSLFKFKKRFSKSEYDFYIGKIIFNQSIYDEICQKWEIENPQKQEVYKYYLFKYKY